MSNRNVFASILMVCLLTIGFGGATSVANAAPAGQSFINPGASAGHQATKIEYRDRDRRIHLPIGPSYLYYDYPYYYSRGYYPRNIGPGYAYDYPNNYRPVNERGYGRCSYWSRRCVANWGHENEDYYGCMNYYGCE